ncbi:MAG: hypothetical protein LBH70_07655, partial [Spirochaetaceae bacterium]|nr:hypothetical protein [Spirochaetaceae bacterium]
MEEKSVDAAAGWLFVTGRMNGSLTAENQRYFIFPYVFFTIDSDTRLHTLFGVLEASYRRGIGCLKVQLGAAHILFGELAADVHSKEESLSYLGRAAAVPDRAKALCGPRGYESIRVSGVGDQNEPPGDKAPASAGGSIDLSEHTAFGPVLLLLNHLVVRTAAVPKPRVFSAPSVGFQTGS